jgi:hypothetical protein
MLLTGAACSCLVPFTLLLWRFIFKVREGTSSAAAQTQLPRYDINLFFFANEAHLIKWEDGFTVAVEWEEKGLMMMSC